MLYKYLLLLVFLILLGCESPTAVKERKKDTTIIRNQGERN